MQEDKININKPNQRHELGLIETWKVIIGNMINKRELIWQLYKRDHLAVHKRSFLGISWIVVTPFVGIISWVFLKGTGLLRPGDVGIPYPAYVLIGSSFWGLFMGIFTSTSLMIQSGSRIIIQVEFPREVLLFKQVLIQLTTFAISFVFNIVIVTAFGIIPSGWTITLPLVVLPLFFVGSGLGLIIALFSVVAMDIKNVATSFIGLLMYITPIIYAGNFDNELIQTLIKYNPMTYLVCSARDIVLFGNLYEPGSYFICAVLSLVFFLISIRLYFVSENKIIERILD